MRPHDNDLDAEIRGHLALSVKERIERGEDPEAARLAALREFGYVPAIRDSMRRVWYSRWFDAVAGLGAGHANWPALPHAREGTGRHRRGNARARHRRQRRDLQRRPRRAAPSPGEPRRRSTDLHPAECAGPRRGEHDVLGAGDRRLQITRHHGRRLRRLLDDRLHADRSRRPPRGAGRASSAARSSR